jgi:hypothetical protein
VEHEAEELFMSRLFLTLLFTLSAVSGLGLLIYGARLKPARNSETPEVEDGIVLEFSSVGEGAPDILELEKGPADMDFDEKKHFDPGKHLPEKIETKKPDGGPDSTA